MSSDRQFKEVEKEFYSLQRKLKERKISETEFRVQLKKLRLRDSQGKCWTIGARTGKWYVFDGKKWVEAKPPSLAEGKAICIYCGYENDLMDEVCSFCGGRMNEKSDNYQKIPITRGTPEQLETQRKESQKTSFIDSDQEVLSHSSIFKIYSCRVFSMFLFFGAIGLFIGMVSGVFFGVMELSSETAGILPSFLRTIQGKLLGGIIFGVIGSFAGFIILGLFGWLVGLFFNLILSFIGGLKFNVSKE